MATELIINATLPETRLALLEDGEIQELHIERDSERGIVGNIYKGKVIRVLPGMQAAFVDIGLEKAAFLYVDDVYFPDMQNPLETRPLPTEEELSRVLPSHSQSRAQTPQVPPLFQGSGEETAAPLILPVPNDVSQGPRVTPNPTFVTTNTAGGDNSSGTSEDGDLQPAHLGTSNSERLPQGEGLRGGRDSRGPRDQNRDRNRDRNRGRGGRDRNAGSGPRPMHGGPRNDQQGDRRPHDPRRGGDRNRGPAGPGRGDRGRHQGGGKYPGGVRPGAATTVVNATNPISPEDHAALQKAYAHQMLDLDEEDWNRELEERKKRQQAALAASNTSSAPAPQKKESSSDDDDSSGNSGPIRAGSDPNDSDNPEDQPTARSPQEEDQEESGAIQAQIRRLDPEIDPSAWAEDIDEILEEKRLEDPNAYTSVLPIGEGVSAGSTGNANEGLTEGSDDDQAAAASEPTPGPSRGGGQGRGRNDRSSRGKQERGPRRFKRSDTRDNEASRGQPSTGNPPAIEDDRDDDSEDAPRRRKRRDSVNIGDLVKEGQEIIVQVAKEPIGTKGARLTCHVSLPGRYLVFMPTVDHIGVSRRIEGETERRRLKETMSRVRPPKTGVIVRTASGKQTDHKLQADLDYLVQTWNDIQKKFQKQKTPSPVYTDLTFVLRAIRDMFTDEVDRVVVDSKREHKSIMKFVMRFMPNVQDKVDLYSGDVPIFDAYGVEPEIDRSLERKVWLKSGGYLVIDQAEALVAIDVNTGRYVGKKNLEETILKTNLEAVQEIAYQLRIRNFGGIIILDLIDMEKESNRDKVFKALDEALKRDRARPTIMKISQLGLIEMTRKRTRDSLVRSICESCSYCKGRGYVKNKDTIAYDIMRDIEREGVDPTTQDISIQCHPTVADVLLEDKRDVIEDLERQYEKKISIRSNGAYHMEQYELMAHKTDGKTVTWQSEERKKHTRQKLQEREQQAASERRKHEQKQAADRRAAREASGPDGEAGEASETASTLDGENAPRRDASNDDGDKDPFRRRRRRGRRGRGRDREAPVGGPRGPQSAPSVRPVVQAGVDGEVQATGVSTTGSTADGQAAAPGTVGGPVGPDGERPRRRGRRGGRRHRNRFRKPGAAGEGAASGGGSPGGSSGDSAPGASFSGDSGGDSGGSGESSGE